MYFHIPFLVLRRSKIYKCNGCLIAMVLMDSNISKDSIDPIVIDSID